MPITYDFLDRGPQTLIDVSDLPVEEGIALSMRTTGYELGTDEIVELAIVDFGGRELFCKRVKPQNIEDWSNAEASGGITPADVAEADELFQFEDQISELFEKASIVVAEHASFAHDIIEASWVTLPDVREFDLSTQFCESHATADHPDQAAPVASLEGIASYYGLACNRTTPADEARTVARCYQALVREHAEQRLAKQPEYWQAYEDERKAQEQADHNKRAKERLEQIKTLRTQAILWVCAFAIMSNLAVQMYIRGFDIGLVILVVAVTVYAVIRWVMSLYRLFKLRNQ